MLTAAFLVNVLVVGQVYSFAVFFPQFIEEFGYSASTTSWIGYVRSLTH